MPTHRDRLPTPRALARLLRRGLPVALAALAACADDDPAGPALTPSSALAGSNELAAEVRRLTAGRGITPLVRPAQVRPALVRLGRALAFDKILSGNRDISCMTCHLPRLATGDARSLSIGQGGNRPGAGSRAIPTGIFIPRNAPPPSTCSRHADALLGRARQS